MSDEKIKFATYRGAGHVAMVAGVPLIPMLILCGVLVFSLFVCVLLLNSLVAASVIASIVISIMIWLKVECAIEPRAMQIRRLELKGLLLRMKGRGHILVTSMKPRKNKGTDDVQRFFKKRYRVR